MSLENHKRHKKKLIPRFLEVIDKRFPGVSWQGQKVPEIIWLCYLSESLGRKQSIRVAIKFAEIFTSNINNKSLIPFFPSTLEKLSKAEIQSIRQNLQKEGLSTLIGNAIISFISIYPQCPLVEIVEIKKTVEPDLPKIKQFIIELSSPSSSETILTFGTVVFALMSIQRINIPPQSPMSKFEHLDNYPDTMESQIVASGIRATINICFVHDIYSYDNEWIKYFWNKSYNYEPAKI